MVAAAFCLAHSFEKSHPESARFHYERGLDLLDRARAASAEPKCAPDSSAGLQFLL